MHKPKFAMGPGDWHLAKSHQVKGPKNEKEKRNNIHRTTLIVKKPESCRIS